MKLTKLDKKVLSIFFQDGCIMSNLYKRHPEMETSINMAIDRLDDCPDEKSKYTLLFMTVNAFLHGMRAVEKEAN